jgi:glyoxylase-like metal-dependent hydrolase (beta-lactamase superfamily II)
MVDVVPLRLGAVNAFLLRGDRPVLVDSGYPGHARAVLAALADNGVAPRELSLIIITHGHHDHFGSAAALRALTGAPIACGQRDAAEIQSGQDRYLTPVDWLGRAAARLPRRPSREAAVEPELMFDGPASLSRWGVDAAVLPAPGHTPGSLAVVPGAAWAERWSAPGRGEAAWPWAVVGDLAIGRQTFAPRGRPPIYAYDRSELAASCRAFAGAELVFAGHGRPLSGGDLLRLAAGLERRSGGSR